MHFKTMKALPYLFALILPCMVLSFIRFEEPWGKDSDLFYMAASENNSPTSPFKKPWNADKKKLNLITNISDKVITFKQKVISPIDGPRSSFRPTSSRYMQLAMYRYGFFKGFIMGCDRLLRENNEKWCYRTIVIDNVQYKYDPAVPDKFCK